MSADPDIAVGAGCGNEKVRCWCCGFTDAPDRMVRLGDHPEVRLCAGCAHFVHQQAWKIEDQESHGPGVAVRDGCRSLRHEIMRRGWHQNIITGNVLRRIGKHLP